VDEQSSYLISEMRKIITRKLGEVSC